MRDDTMLIHHALYPESEKGLGFQAPCIYERALMEIDEGKNVNTIKQEMTNVKLC